MRTILLQAIWGDAAESQRTKDRKLQKAMIMHILKGHGTQKKKNHNESQFNLY